MKKEKTQINEIRCAKGEITTNTTEIQEIIRDYFESLYSNKFENFEEMDRLLDTYNHPNLSQEDINYLNKSIIQNKVKQQLRVFQKTKVQDLRDSLLNSVRHLKEN
jgi:ABC-type siderophore export system fused ATPase/permease subunit